MQNSPRISRPASSAPRHARKPGSAAGGFLGIALLAAGLTALAGVGFWGYGLLTAPGTSQDARQTAATASPGEAPAQDSALLAEAGKASIPPETAFQGLWEADFNGGQGAVIGFDKGRYVISVTPNPALPQRLYTEGAYRYDSKSGVLELTPSPATLPQSSSGLIYESLTRRAYKIQIALNTKSGHLFLKPTISGTVRDQVHPLFFHAGSGKQTTGWRRREGKKAP